MHRFVRELITEWRRLDLPTSGETAVLGVSGGADSVSLLLGFAELRDRKKHDLRIVAAHFNHGLRGSESDADEQFVRELAGTLGVELAVGKGSISTQDNLEQNARRARYAFLSQTAATLHSFGVLTGHTINDQAETFLLNLLRGSGPDGLSGMQPMRPLNEAKEQADDAPNLFSSQPLLIRPLLRWAKREDTEQYCHSLGIAYRYDTMNEDTAFKRVRIRKILLPLLKDFNPKIIETLANTAFLLQDLPAAGDTRNRTGTSGELNLQELRSLSESELFAAIRQWLAEQRGTTRQLELKHIQAVARLLLSTKSGRTVEIPGGKVVKTRGHITYKDNKVEN